MSAWLDRHALWLIVAAGAVLRFATLTGQGLWFDEQVTAGVVDLGIADLLAQVQAGESNPGLYYLVLGGWERVLGNGDFALRSFSALAGTLTIPVVYLAAKELFGRRAGLFAAALAATSPMLIWYSQEVRNYELMVLVASASFLCFVKALDDAGHRWLWGWAVVSGLALTTHYFTVFLIVAEAGWLLARRPAPRVDTALPIAGLLAVALALAPLAASQRGRGSWIDEYELSGRLAQVPQHFLVGLEVPWAWLGVAAAAIMVAAVAYGVARTDERTRRAFAVAASVALGGFAVLLAAAAIGSDYILSRNLLELWPAAAVAIAGALASERAGWIGSAALGALAAIGVSLAIWTAATPAAQRPDYPGLARALPAAAEPRAEPRLIVSNSSFSSPLTRYLDGSRLATGVELATTELVVITPRAIDDHAIGVCWWIATCGGPDVEVPPPFEPPAGFVPTAEGSTDQFDYTVYRAERPTPIERPPEYFTSRVFAQEPRQ